MPKKCITVLFHIAFCFLPFMHLLHPSSTASAATLAASPASSSGLPPGANFAASSSAPEDTSSAAAAALSRRRATYRGVCPSDVLKAAFQNNIFLWITLVLHSYYLPCFRLCPIVQQDLDHILPAEVGGDV